jgi:hypothetical protein
MRRSVRAASSRRGSAQYRSKRRNVGMMHLNEYETALKSDPSLAFAQQGKVRSAARALLAQRLQALIDRPEQLASAARRARMPWR